MSTAELGERPGSWSCTVSGNVRSLGKVLMAFDKIGRDLFIQAEADRLQLRTLNAAQSAYCQCTLPSAFFDDMLVDGTPPSVKIWLKVGALDVGTGFSPWGAVLEHT